MEENNFQHNPEVKVLLSVHVDVPCKSALGILLQEEISEAIKYGYHHCSCLVYIINAIGHPFHFHFLRPLIDSSVCHVMSCDDNRCSQWKRSSVQLLVFKLQHKCLCLNYRACF